MENIQFDAIKALWSGAKKDVRPYKRIAGNPVSNSDHLHYQFIHHIDDEGEYYSLSEIKYHTNTHEWVTIRGRAISRLYQLMYRCEALGLHYVFDDDTDEVVGFWISDFAILERQNHAMNKGKTIPSIIDCSSI